MAQASRSEITVLGAGVAGLSVAIALARAGHGVTVLERAEEIREVGAGLQISPNGMRVLSALGLDPDAQNRAMLSQGVVLRDHFNGAEIARLKLPQDPGTRMMHRADLIDMLAEGARAVGVQLRLLHQIDSVEIEGDGTPQLRLVTGGVLRPDILIGADGLHSPTRRAILGPRAEKPKFTGQVAWRAIVPGRSGDPVEASVYM
ncbi:MAG: salicylate hydroxylase, partial [Polaromonas sp.]